MRTILTVLLLTCGVNALGFPYNVNVAAVKSSQVSGTWTNFLWTMNSGSDQSFIFHTDQQGITTAYLRFGIDASATNYPLEWQSTTIQLTATGSVFQGYLSRTSIPPERVWYAEFMGVLGTNSVDAGMTLGRGRINVTASLFNDANYVTQIVQQITSSTNETDPIYLAASTGLMLKVDALAADAALSNSVNTLTGQVATIQSTMATNGQWNAQIAAVSNYAGSIVGGVTNIGTGLSGNGTTTTLSVNTAVVASVAALTSSGAAHNARMDTFIASATASNSFYPASNPSNYVTGAGLTASNYASVAVASNLFVSKTAGSMSGSLDMNSNSIFHAVGIGSADQASQGIYIDLINSRVMDGPTQDDPNDYTGLWRNFNADLLDSNSASFYLDYANITNKAGVATNGQWNASVAGSSNLAWAIGSGASNYANTVGAAVGLGATNLSIAIGLGASNDVDALGLAATNLHLAQGVQITNLQAATASLTSITVSAGAGITNAQVTASNAVPWLSLTGAVSAITATNLPAGYTNLQSISIASNDSQVALTIGQYGDGGYASRAVRFVSRGEGSGATNDLISLRYATGQYFPYWVNAGTTQAIYGAYNFSPSSYVLFSDFTTYQTNAIKLYSGSVTQNQIGARNQAWFDGTNLVFGLGGTNWLRFGGSLNAF